jgi:hypothetical protein
MLLPQGLMLDQRALEPVPMLPQLVTPRPLQQTQLPQQTPQQRQVKWALRAPLPQAKLLAVLL